MVTILIITMAEMVMVIDRIITVRGEIEPLVLILQSSIKISKEQMDMDMKLIEEDPNEEVTSKGEETLEVEMTLEIEEALGIEETLEIEVTLGVEGTLRTEVTPRRETVIITVQDHKQGVILETEVTIIIIIIVKIEVIVGIDPTEAPVGVTQLTSINKTLMFCNFVGTLIANWIFVLRTKQTERCSAEGSPCPCT